MGFIFAMIMAFSILLSSFPVVFGWVGSSTAKDLSGHYNPIGMVNPSLKEAIINQGSSADVKAMWVAMDSSWLYLMWEFKDIVKPQNPDVLLQFSISVDNTQTDTEGEMASRVFVNPLASGEYYGGINLDTNYGYVKIAPYGADIRKTSTAAQMVVSVSTVTDVVECKIAWAPSGQPAIPDPASCDSWNFTFYTMYLSVPPGYTWRCFDPQEWDDPTGNGEEWNGLAYGPDAIDVPGDEFTISWTNYSNGFITDADPRWGMDNLGCALMDNYYTVHMTSHIFTPVVDGNPTEWFGSPAYMGPDPVDDTQLWARSRLHLVDELDGDELITVLPCTDFNVSIIVQNISKLFNWEVVLTWNPTQLLCKRFIYSVPSFLPTPTWEFPGVIDNVGGTFSTAYARSVAPPGIRSANGTGLLATVEFHCEDFGTSIINITDATLIDVNLVQLDVPWEGIKVVQAPPPPEQGTVKFTEDASGGTAPIVINFAGSTLTQAWNDITLTYCDATDFAWEVIAENGSVYTPPNGAAMNFNFTEPGLWKVRCKGYFASMDPQYPGMVWSEWTDNATKLIKPPLAPTGIDCYTELERWSGYTACNIGDGWNQAADAYALDEEVSIYANVTYGGDAVQSRLVMFEVYDAVGELVLVETAMTNEYGVAGPVSFRIETVCGDPEHQIGKWSCFQKVYMCEKSYNDTLYWDVAWIVELQDVVLTTKQAGVWKPSAIANKYDPNGIGFNIYFKSWAQCARVACLAITVYDDNNVPVIVDIKCSEVAGGTYCDPQEGIAYIQGLLIPKWAYAGPNWKVRVSLSNDLPTLCGHPWSPPVETGFSVVV